MQQERKRKAKKEKTSANTMKLQYRKSTPLTISDQCNLKGRTVV